MATKGNTYLTLADLLKQQEGGEITAQIIELLSETNPILDDAVVSQANNGQGNLTTVRTGLPNVVWRQLYQGVQPSKSSVKQVQDAAGMLEAWSEVDAKLVELSNDPAQFRLNESSAFLEAMNQEMAYGLFYNDTDVDPEKPMGLAPRFSDLSAENGDQIVDGGGTGSDNTSIWFVVWGERTCHLFYPQGSQAGLNRSDKGMQVVDDGSGGKYDAYQEKFSWDIGLSVRDWRYIARIANIDVSDLTVDASGGANLFQLMVEAYWKLQQRRVTGGQAAIYANPTIMEYLDHQSRNANSNVYLRWEEAGPDSEPVLMFRDMPIRETDAITETEAQVS